MKTRIDQLGEMVAAGNRSQAIQDENKWLKKQLEETLEQLETARKARGLVLPSKAAGGKPPKVFTRLICGDLHGSHADTEVVAALLKDVGTLDIREVVYLGDMAECGGWLAMSHTLGYVAQLDESSYEDDVAATSDFLDKVERLTPKAKKFYIEGNHEHRVERWCVDACQGSRRNAEFLMRAVAPAHVLNLAKRGIPYFGQSDKHDGLEVPGTIRLGKSYFTHGFSCSKHAASATLEKYAGCVFFGHTHRADVATTRLVNVGLVAAWNPGCLCKLQPRWHHSAPTGWNHGYIIQLVDQETGDFLTIPVPINGGKSYLTALLNAFNS